MNTFDFINKLAAYKVAVATGEVDPVKSVGEIAGEPDSLQKSTFERAVDNFGPEMLAIVPGGLVHGMEEFGNYKYDQSTPVGELFADFANSELKKKGLTGEIFYTQTVPRTLLKETTDGSDIARAVQSVFVPKTPSISAYSSSVIAGNTEEEKKLLRKYFADPFTRDMNKHLADYGSSDRFEKALLQGDDWIGQMQIAMNREMRNGSDKNTAFAKALEEQLTNIEPFKNARGFVRTPRNNMRALAHEFGHIESEMNEGKLVDSPVGPVYNFVKTVVSDPLNGLYERFAPDFIKKPISDIYNKLDTTGVGRVINGIAPTFLGAHMTLPTSAVTGIKLVDTISPETFNSLKEKDPTGILEFVEEHPVSSSIIAGLPQVVRETVTTVPGTRMTYNFWKAIKDGNNQFMKDHVFADQVRKGLGDLSKINPTWEAAKFFGKNLGKATIGITAPMLGLMAVDKLKDWINSKDE